MLLATTNTNFRLLPTIPTAKILSLEEWHREQLSLRAEKRLFKSATGSRRRELARSRTRKDELEDSGTEPEDERSRAEEDANREKQEGEEFFGDPPLTQQRERNVAWFTDHFLGRAHHTYLALSSPVGPLAVSIILDQHDHTYKLIIRSTRGSQRLTVPFSVVPPPSFFRRLFGYGYDPLSVLAVASPATPQRTLRYCTDPYLPKELLAVEERQVIRSYKFGVGYVGGEIPANEESMLSCRLEQTSPAFHEFLAWLGDTVELKGWKGYRGGLDVKDNSTGTHSVYTEFHGYEIMYHVSPLLPNTARDIQHVERKRHIGNDIVLIVFRDRVAGGQVAKEVGPFQLDTVVSRQNHVVCVVSPNDDDGYDFAIAIKEGIPPFVPEVPEPARLRKDKRGREWLLHKLINGERAAYQAPCFANKISRTRHILLYDVVERFHG